MSAEIENNLLKSFFALEHVAYPNRNIKITTLYTHSPKWLILHIKQGLKGTISEPTMAVYITQRERERQGHTHISSSSSSTETIARHLSDSLASFIYGGVNLERLTNIGRTRVITSLLRSIYTSNRIERELQWLRPPGYANAHSVHTDLSLSTGVYIYIQTRAHIAAGG